MDADRKSQQARQQELFDQLFVAIERLRRVPPGRDNAKEYEEVCAINDALNSTTPPPPRRKWWR